MEMGSERGRSVVVVGKSSKWLIRNRICYPILPSHVLASGNLH
jgi:hypothetical protein